MADLLLVVFTLSVSLACTYVHTGAHMLCINADTTAVHQRSDRWKDKERGWAASTLSSCLSHPHNMHTGARR